MDWTEKTFFKDEEQLLLLACWSLPVDCIRFILEKIESDRSSQFTFLKGENSQAIQSNALILEIFGMFAIIACSHMNGIDGVGGFKFLQDLSWHLLGGNLGSIPNPETDHRISIGSTCELMRHLERITIPYLFSYNTEPKKELVNLFAVLGRTLGSSERPLNIEQVDGIFDILKDGRLLSKGAAMECKNRISAMDGSAYLEILSKGEVIEEVDVPVENVKSNDKKVKMMVRADPKKRKYYLHITLCQKATNFQKEGALSKYARDNMINIYKVVNAGTSKACFESVFNELPDVSQICFIVELGDVQKPKAIVSQKEVASEAEGIPMEILTGMASMQT